MSDIRNVVYDESCFLKRVPKKIKERTKENMEVYHMSLYDSFQEAVREYVTDHNSKLWKAFYYDDFREYIPCVYEGEYLDFTKYPLKYKGK